MRTVPKCDLNSMQFCAPMLNRVMGKFSDGTLRIVSRIDPASGHERYTAEIVLIHPGPEFELSDESLWARLFRRVSGHRPRRSPFALRLNWCPWCGAFLAERERPEVSRSNHQKTAPSLTRNQR